MDARHVCRALLVFPLTALGGLRAKVVPITYASSRSEENSTLPSALSRLPPEVQELILEHIIDSFLNKSQLVRQLRISRNEAYLTIRLLAECLPRWRAIAVKKLVSTWATGESDWAEGAEANVRILTAGEGTLRSGFNLSPFRNLQVASLNFHAGFKYEKRSNVFTLNTCVAELPPSLERLEVLGSHGPDSKIFRLVERCCPNLTELSLVRCTLFNNPTCTWWRGHPEQQQHSYMRGQDVLGITNYAVFVGSQLRNIPKLQTLHIGDYYAPFNGIAIHRWDHKRHHPTEDQPFYVNPALIHSNLHWQAMQAQDDGPPININLPRPADREIWSAHCPDCVKEFATPTEAAERCAASVLASIAWSLHTISFASFVLDGRISPSSWEVTRSTSSPPVVESIEEIQGQSGIPFHVGTYRTGNPLSIQWESFTSTGIEHI